MNDLIKAIDRQDTLSVLKYVKLVDLAEINKNNYSPLYHAICTDNLEIVQILLDNKHNPNIPYVDSWGETDMIYYSKSKEMTKLLLAYGADPNGGRFDHGAVGWAIIDYLNDMDMIRLFVGCGLTDDTLTWISFQCESLTIPFIKIYMERNNIMEMKQIFTSVIENYELFKYLDELGQIDYNYVSDTGQTLLTAAIRHNNQLVINKIIESDHDMLLSVRCINLNYNNETILRMKNGQRNDRYLMEFVEQFKQHIIINNELVEIFNKLLNLNLVYISNNTINDNIMIDYLIKLDFYDLYNELYPDHELTYDQICTIVKYKKASVCIFHKNPYFYTAYFKDKHKSRPKYYILLADVAK